MKSLPWVLLAIAVLALWTGPILVFCGRIDRRQADAFSETPRQVRLSELIEKGIDPNRHVVVTDYRFLGPYLVKVGRNQPMRAFVPIAPAEEDDGRATPARPRFLVRPANVRNESDVERSLRNPRPIQGMAIPAPGFMQNVGGGHLHLDEKQELLNTYPGTDLDEVVVIEEHGRPTPEILISAQLIGGWAMIALGPVLLLVSWDLRRRARRIPVVDLA